MNDVCAALRTILEEALMVETSPCQQDGIGRRWRFAMRDYKDCSIYGWNSDSSIGHGFDEIVKC